MNILNPELDEENEFTKIRYDKIDKYALVKHHEQEAKMYLVKYFV